MSEIKSHTLRDGDVAVTVLSMGCAVQDWQVGGRRVVLGYADPEDYRQNPASMNVVVGRVANRIAEGRFTLDGETVQLPVDAAGIHLHGGPEGLGWQNWDMTVESPRCVVLRHQSPDGHMGYPGTVDFTVRITLTGHRLRWEMTGTPDRATPIAMAQHLYFNLNGEGLVTDHALQVHASQITLTDDSLVTTGETAPVAGTRFDYRQPRVIAEADPEGEGYDLNFVLDGGDGPQAVLTAPDGMTLRLWTDQPGLQVYNSLWLEPTLPALGTPHRQFAGLCLEAQDVPNAVNLPDFGSVIRTPNAPYRQVTEIEITPA